MSFRKDSSGCATTTSFRGTCVARFARSSASTPNILRSNAECLSMQIYLAARMFRRTPRQQIGPLGQCTWQAALVEHNPLTPHFTESVGSSTRRLHLEWFDVAFPDDAAGLNDRLHTLHALHSTTTLAEEQCLQFEF